MSGIKRDKPSQEFWDRARELIEWATPEELRILRIMCATELEKRLKQWSAKIEVTPEAKARKNIEVTPEAKARKNKAIKRNINKAAKT